METKCEDCEGFMPEMSAQYQWKCEQNDCTSAPVSLCPDHHYHYLWRLKRDAGIYCYICKGPSKVWKQNKFA